MSPVRRVLLVEPIEGARWRSITVYSATIRQMLVDAGIHVDTAVAPWFNPPSIARGTAGRWWRQKPFGLAAEGAYDLIHLADHALAHHWGRFSPLTPVVVTCHDVMPFTLPGYFGSRPETILKRTFLRRPLRALRHAAAVIAVSEFTRDELLRTRRVQPDAVAVVPNATRRDFRPRPRHEAEALLAGRGILLPPRPRVLSVGNNAFYKNPGALLNAMAGPALAHASLVRVGGPLPARFAGSLAADGALRRTTGLGSVDDETLALLYSACDVLAQPSLGEGFGIPVIEAMASGLPVVASDGGALPEVVGDAGIVVPLCEPDFPGRFARAIGEALARREQLAAAGLERVRRFDPHVVGPALLAAYELAIERSTVDD